MLAIENGTVWTGQLGENPSLQTILIEDSRIARIVPHEVALDLPFDAQRIDAKDTFVMPGLINVHTHMIFDGSADPHRSLENGGVPRVVVGAMRSASVTLSGGITTVRDLGASLGLDFSIKHMISDGIIEGPHMLASGPPICMTGGHGYHMGGEADGPFETRKAARMRLKAGADQLKVMATGGVMTGGVEPGAPQLTVEEMRTVVEEAEKAGTYVAAHCHGNTGIRNALLAGIRTIEHGTLMGEDTADLMAQKGAYLTPTFVSAKRIADHGIEAGIADAVRKVRQMMERRERSLALALDRGIPVIIGTDAGTPMNHHGMAGYLDQMAILHSLGMTVEQILVGATSLAAKALAIADTTGTLGEGMRADVLILDGNPMVNLDALKRPRMVIKSGRQTSASSTLP